jgi:peptidoglycan/LPS O-acetylase OafA/YrhL
MTAPPEQRLRWLDGLRGIAALQVILLHYLSAFGPAIGLPDPALQTHWWQWAIGETPLYALINGSAGVNLFFLLSGAALTFSFGRQPFALAHAALRRVIRLGLPMAAATAGGAALLWIWPGAHIAAAHLTGSLTWLGAISPPAPSAGMALHQILLEGMLTGYSDMTLLPSWLTSPLALAPLLGSVNAPLWTLHIEFIGSLLVLLLVMVRAIAPAWAHYLACAAAAAALCTSPLVLFVIGHALAPLLHGTLRGIGWRLLGTACVATGIGLATAIGFDAVQVLLTVLPQPPLGPATDLLHFQFMLAALFTFLGVMLLPPAQTWLTRATAQALGRWSFSLYLIHFPLLFTAVCAVFLRLSLAMPFILAASIACIAGLAATFALAAPFARFVDRPAIRLSRIIGATPSRQQ